jgi:glucosamine-6-phosphate deaminase
MGIGTIRGARAIRVIVTGVRKATAVRALVHGPENPDWPCSFLHAHADIEVFMDASAAAAL